MVIADRLAALDQWLVEARAVLDTLPDTDSRHSRARALLAARQAERDRLAEELAAARPPVQRFPWHVRWARERGVLEVRDVFDGSWIAVDAHEAPGAWRREAQRRAQAARRLAQQVLPLETVA